MAGDKLGESMWLMFWSYPKNWLKGGNGLGVIWNTKVEDFYGNQIKYLKK